MAKSTTIKDIARIAGVSTAAVSMALNQKPGVGEDTRRKIVRIARAHNYRPNFIAKSLVSKRSYSLGLIVADLADPFFTEIARGIEEKANDLDYSIILCSTNRELAREKDSIEMLRAKGVDGIILASVTHNDPNIEQLIEDEFPFVLVNRLASGSSFFDSLDYVVLDNDGGGYRGIEHLYRLGHDRIAIIAGEMNTSTAMQRTAGAQRAVSELGIGTGQARVVECCYNRNLAYAAAQRLLQENEPPTAFFTQDDQMALSVREAVLEAGLSIPQDIALIGFDDIDTVAVTGVDLTTISQNIYEMGTKGVEILNDKIEQQDWPHPCRIVLEAQLIVRKSCGYHMTGYVR